MQKVRWERVIKIMETTIKVSKETLRRVNKMKYNLDAKSHDETLNRILDIIEKVGESK